MKDQLAKAKSELLDALRKAERDGSSRQVTRKLEKIIGSLESLQHSV